MFLVCTIAGAISGHRSSGLSPLILWLESYPWWYVPFVRIHHSALENMGTKGQKETTSLRSHSPA